MQKAIPVFRNARTGEGHTTALGQEGVTAMSDNTVIKTADELEFAVFCIENIAIKLKKNAAEVYQALTEKSNILNSYIIPEYEILHTQSKDYIVDDIISLMEERGIRL